eukprot:CAMPEP_0184480302 /NCGR_PEP_ID=MMETSP0113_2-20130426/1796_1 /TAXON_ID=91329 /ORGANISM="Norrisiella sphaerica, Strain BC52" /LENGTH=268 /DNA_ID=CAMNT_0026858689 /DNA_START=320 /DNA_END=1126 /DNA_ORIENTATION=+
MMATPFMRRPDSWVDRGTSASLSSITGVAGRRRRRRAMATHARDPSIPDVIVEAERKSNQQRPLRFAGYGLFGLYGAAVVLSNAGMLPEDLTLPLTFFDSEAVSLGIGGVAAVLSAYFINTEIEQREQNINRIWEEVQRRKETGTFGVKDSVTSQQKTGAGKKKKKQKRAKAKKGFGGETQRSVDMQKSVDVPIQKPEREKFVGEVKEEVKSGMFDGIVGSVKDSVQQANTMARVQALQLNEALEDRGVLPRLNETAKATSDKEKKRD